MKTILSTPVLLFLIFIYSCKSEPKQRWLATADMMEPPPPPPVMERSIKFIPPSLVADENAAAYYASEVVESDRPVIKKKIIKDGNIAIKSNDVAGSKKNIDELVKANGSYYDSEEYSNNDNETSYDLKIRIPSDNFEKLIAALENGKDEITSKSIQSRDVTEEYIDVEASLSSKREFMKRYKDLLSKASSVKDILAIEENIGPLQEEIESREGRLKYLNDQVSYSTLDLRLFKEKEFVYKPKQQDKFSERVKNSLSNGWSSLINFVLWLIKVWPGIILTILFIFFVKRFIKRRKRN